MNISTTVLLPGIQSSLDPMYDSLEWYILPSEGSLMNIPPSSTNGTGSGRELYPKYVFSTRFIADSMSPGSHLRKYSQNSLMLAASCLLVLNLFSSNPPSLSLTGPNPFMTILCDLLDVRAGVSEATMPPSAPMRSRICRSEEEMSSAALPTSMRDAAESPHR